MHTQDEINFWRYKLVNPDTGKRYTNDEIGHVLGVDGSVASRKIKGVIRFKAKEIDNLWNYWETRHSEMATAQKEGSFTEAGEHRVFGRDKMQRRMETCLSDVRQLFSTEDEQIIDLLEYGISILKRQTKKKADRLQKEVNKLKGEMDFPQGGQATAPGAENG